MPPLTPNQKIAHLIKRNRRAFKLSQAELAKRAGTTQATIAHLEAGTANPRLSTLSAIAGVFGASPAIEFKKRG